MHKFILFALFLEFLAPSISANVPEKPNKTMSLIVEPALLGLGFLDTKFSFKTGQSTAMVLVFDTHLFWPPLTAQIALPSELFGIGGGIGLKWRPQRAIFEDGFYVMPLVRVGYSALLPKTSSQVAIISSVEGGYDWYFDSGLNLSTGLSINYLYVPKVTAGYVPRFPLPLLHFAVGYYF